MSTQKTLKSSGINWNDVEKPNDNSLFIKFDVYNSQFDLKIKEFLEVEEASYNGKTFDAYKFIVDDLVSKTEKEWSVTSKRLLQRLKELEPIIGKKIRVIKTGTGFQTVYTVVEI